MVQKVQIENFKSISSLTLELGRVNVFIGENGCGKTNILEAIAFGSAAAANKLDNEFLFSRGLRVTEPHLMTSAFEKKNAKEEIKIHFIKGNGEELNFDLYLDDNTWTRPYKKHINTLYKEYLELKKVFTENKHELDGEELKILGSAIRQIRIDTDKILEQITSEISSFLTYSLENHFLRRFEEEGQIQPLGTKGEGLFKHLVEIQKNKPEIFALIQENLAFIDWFEGFEIPKDLMFTERRIQIQDRFLDEGWQYFDQRSANEGFLFLLFYLTLFASDRTPRFFAIDNIDTAFNPKLCAKVIQILVELAKKQEKQVIMTTHNPAILDGLDLTDDEQRLFVVSRNKLGHTLVKRIEKKEPLENQKPVKLSEQFLRGYIGGLPKNF